MMVALVSDQELDAGGMFKDELNQRMQQCLFVMHI